MVHRNRLFQTLCTQRSPAPSCSAGRNQTVVGAWRRSPRLWRWHPARRAEPGGRGGQCRGDCHQAPMWGKDGKKEITLLLEEEMGKASREKAEKEGREGSLLYRFCGLHFSHGNLLGKDLSLPPRLGCPSPSALIFLPSMPSSLSGRGTSVLACRGALWSSSAWLTRS